MKRTTTFPPSGFLWLGILSLVASAVFVIRAAAVDATAERIWSAALYLVIGGLWLLAYRSADHDSSD